MRGWFLALGLVGCTSDTSTPDDDAPADTDTPTGDTDTGTTDSDTDEPVSTLPQALNASIEDEAGNPLPGWSVKFCNLVGCRITTTNAYGVFAYDEISLEPHSLEPVPPEGSAYATMNLPFTFEPDEVKNIALTALKLEDTTLIPASPTEMELGTDLFVTIGAEDLDPPDAFHPAPTTAGGVRVPQEDWPPIDDVTGTVLAVWYTHPFDYDATGGLPVRIAGNLGLGEGEGVQLLVGSYSDFAWIDGGTLTVTGGELVGTAELPLLSTILAVQQ
jgi:hypothetical protein